jgi:arylsulfatase A-like enzyme
LPEPKHSDGISFAPALLGGEQAEHEYLYFDYGHARERFHQAIRWKGWKGVRNGVGTPLELYDLTNDPAEERNVAANHADIVERIERYLEEAYEPSADYPVKGFSEPRTSR